MPDKMTISHRGARYEIGRGKRYYGIWVVGAPESAPIDRWPETREGWAQAWTRFASIETPGTIHPVEQPRPGLRLPGLRLSRLRPSGQHDGTSGSFLARLPIVAAAFLGLGLILGIVGLFPYYFTGQSLAVQPDELVPHLLYLAGWAVSAVLVLRGGGRARIGALLGIGLSAVTFGLFLSDLGQVLSGASGLEAGLVLSIVGWAACTIGAAVGLAVRPGMGRAATAAGFAPAAEAGAVVTDMGGVTGTSTDMGGVTGTSAGTGGDTGTGAGVTQSQDTPDTIAIGAQDYPDTIAMGPQDTGDTIATGEPGAATAWVPSAAATSEPPTAGTAAAGTAADGVTGVRVAGNFAGPASVPLAGAPLAGAPDVRNGGPGARRGGPVRPSAQHAGPVALLVLGAIGTVAAFAPSWDSYTLSSPATGTQTIVAGNAFTQPGWVIAGDVAVMIAVVAVAALAALWRPMRQGAALLAGAIVPMAAQAISAIIQVRSPTSPGQFGISPSQASAAGLSISNGLTPIFWVYCVFVIALLISCAWLVTEPAQPASVSTLPSWPGPIGDPIPLMADDSGANAGDSGENTGNSGESTADSGENTGNSGENTGDSGENTGDASESAGEISGETREETGAGKTDKDRGTEDGGAEDDEENTYA